MKKYTKPSVKVVELSVRESLSDLPATFRGGFGYSAMKAVSGNVSGKATLYRTTSKLTSVSNS